jgi:ectoine hydroxylase-related dioxygenase (phytanoyl-CoA dioxygenase family)
LEYAQRVECKERPHRRSALAHFAYELAEHNALDFRAVPLARGGAIVHDSYSVHRSGPNKTGQTRRAMAFSYRSVAGARLSNVS